MLILHILGAMVWIGAAVKAIAGDALMASESGAARAAMARVNAELGKRLYSPAAVLVLITGIVLVTDSDGYGFGSVFVSVGFLAVIAGAGIGMGIFGPRYARAAELHDAGDTAGAEAVERSFRPIQLLEVLLLAVTVVAMVMKWGA